MFLPSGRSSCPLLVPGGAGTAPTALTFAMVPYQVDFQTDHLAHFSSSLASGGHGNRPTSHGLPNFALNQSLPLRRILKSFGRLQRCPPDMPFRAEPGPPRLSSRAEGAARSRGICKGAPGRFPRSLRSALLPASCSRWHQNRFHRARFSHFPVPGGLPARPPRTLFQLLRQRWSRKQAHIARLTELCP